MSNILCQCQQMSRSCGVLTSRKGESRSKSLDKLASANCRTTVCQLVYDRPPIGVRPYGNCRMMTLNGFRDDFSRGRMEGDRLKCFKPIECLSRCPKLYFIQVLQVDKI